MLGWFVHHAIWLIVRCGTTIVFCWTLQQLIRSEAHYYVDLHVFLIGAAMMIVVMRLWMPRTEKQDVERIHKSSSD
jgi:hypothetical protein